MPRRRRPRRGRRWGWLAGPPCWRREAWESITTRRRPPGPTSPGCARPCASRAWGARARAVAGAGAPALGTARCAGGGRRGGGGGGRWRAAVGGWRAGRLRRRGRCRRGVAGVPGGASGWRRSRSRTRRGAVAPSAFSATASSTEEAAALASTPAALSFSSSSLLERPCSLAISCTRFLLIGSPILRARRRSSPRSAARGAMPAAPRRPARRHSAAGSPASAPGTGRRRDRASCRRGRCTRATGSARPRRAASAMRTSSDFGAIRPQPTQRRCGARCAWPQASATPVPAGVRAYRACVLGGLVRQPAVELLGRPRPSGLARPPRPRSASAASQRSSASVGCASAPRAAPRRCVGDGARGRRRCRWRCSRAPGGSQGRSSASRAARRSGQRRPLERIAAQRPCTSSSS